MSLAIEIEKFEDVVGAAIANLYRKCLNVELDGKLDTATDIRLQSFLNDNFLFFISKF